jgi:hypothetical protein
MPEITESAVPAGWVRKRFSAAREKLENRAIQVT